MTKHICFHCNNHIVEYEGDGVLEIKCQNCNFVQNIKNGKINSGQVSNDFNKECRYDFCSSCDRPIAKTIGKLKFSYKCKFCGRINNVNTEIDLNESLDGVVLPSRPRKKLIRS
jgi:phage FluMu protein Com